MWCFCHHFCVEQQEGGLFSSEFLLVHLHSPSQRRAFGNMWVAVTCETQWKLTDNWTTSKAHLHPTSATSRFPANSACRIAQLGQSSTFIWFRRLTVSLVYPQPEAWCIWNTFKPSGGNSNPLLVSSPACTFCARTVGDTSLSMSFQKGQSETVEI